jgi:phage terminase large subunit
MVDQVIEVPDWAQPLYDPESPYRDFVLYGGRGGAKSYAMCYAALTRGIDRKERIVGLRETMKSTDQSIHALLSSIIHKEGWEWHYRILEDEIRGKNGTEIFYSGLRKSSSARIKSLAGVTIGLMDEAAEVSDSSMRDYLPTIREKGSQRWYAFNPRSKNDSVYQRFVLNSSPDSYVKKVSWRDNPWWNDELEKDRIQDERTRPWDYAHVWEGELLTASSDSVYARQMVDATTSNRIGYFAYDPATPVHCAWDIGGTGTNSDATAIWFFQLVQGAIVIIDYWESIGQAVFEIIPKIKAKGYNWGVQYLPHDSVAHHPTSLRSVADYVKDGQIGDYRVLARSDIQVGIDNVKANFHRLHIDKGRCEIGIEALNGFTGKHDHFSHGADAARYMMQAVSVHITPRPRASSNVRAGSVTKTHTFKQSRSGRR